MKLPNLLLAVVFTGACRASATPPGLFVSLDSPSGTSALGSEMASLVAAKQPVANGGSRPDAFGARGSARQDLTKKLDYTTVAVPLSRALADLSGQAGLKLMVSDDLANEIIVLRLKAVTTDEAMKRIASTVGAEWHHVDAGFMLERTDELAAKLHEQGLTARAAGMKSMIDKQLKLSGANEAFTDEKATVLAAHYNQTQHPTGSQMENYQVQKLIEKALPDSRAIWKVLSMIDPRKICEMQSGQRLVFSNQPTPMQLPIDGDLSDIGSVLQTEHNIFATALSKATQPDPKREPIPISDPGEKVQMKSAPIRFVISLQLLYLSQTYMVQMIGFDDKNVPVFVGNTTMDVMEDDSDMMAQRTRVARANVAEPKLPVSPVTQLMLDFMKKSIGGGVGGMQPATGDLRTALLNPDKKDPLAYTFSEAFLGIAERRNENMVAYPDDSAFLLGMFAGMEGELKPSLVMQALTGLGPMVPTNVTEQDGWLTVAPADLPEAVQTRTSRSALGDFLRAYDKTGYLTLDAVGKLAITVNGREFPVLDMFLPMMVDQGGADIQQSGDLNMLKLYGSLDDGQLNRLNTQQAIRLADMRPEQAAFVSRYVYEPNNRFANGWVSREGESQAQVAAENEPTETLPNGLPNQTTLSMNSKDAKVYFVKVEIGSGGSYTSPMSIDSLAWTVHLKDHPNEAPGYSPDVLSISPGTERTIQVTIGISDKNRPQCELKEHRPSAGGPWTLDKLPADVKKELDAALLRFNRVNQQSGQDDGAAEAAPPVQVAPPALRG